MRRGFFITGTDTGVGKTVVTAGLLRALRHGGVDAVPVKPVQTGCLRQGDALLAPDLEFSLNAAGLTPDPDERALMAPYCYDPACSPHLAGRMAGEYPDCERIAACIDELMQRHDAVLVEGAGGIMVPLDESATMLDLMRNLGLPVILVARAGLGTINHSLLSVRVLRSAGLDVAGVVFNEEQLPDTGEQFIRADNPAAVARFGDVEILGAVPHQPGLAGEGSADWQDFERGLSALPRLLERIRQ
jgi:dethiobiotin synthase